MQSLANDPKLLDSVIKAIEASTLTDRQKAVAIRKLRFRPRIRQLILDEVIAQGYSEGVILPGEGDAVALIDWEEFAKFLERIIPLIIQIIGLFG